MALIGSLRSTQAGRFGIERQVGRRPVNEQFSSRPLQARAFKSRVGRKAQLERLLALLIAAVLGSSSCKCAPKVNEVKIVPTEVYVTPGQIFSLQAKLYDDDGRPIPEFYGYRPRWESTNPSLMLRSYSGHAAVFEASHAEGTINVAVEVARNVRDEADGSRFTSATVTIQSGTSGDFVSAEHSDDDPPEVALVDWFVASENRLVDNTTVAFARLAPLGNLVDPTGPPDGEVAVFSASREMGLKTSAAWKPGQTPVNWTTAPGDEADFTRNQDQLLARLDILVDVWIDEGADDEGVSTAGVVLIAIADASRTFAASRAGVAFVVRTVYEFSMAEAANCLVNVNNLLVGEPYDPATLSVFVVEEVADAAGWYCGPDPPLGGPRVFVGVGALTATTLAHEFGHALGRLGAENMAGHTGGVIGLEDMPGFNESNLMWALETDKLALARSHLSLGQAFRVNVDSKSWVNMSGPPSLRQVRLSGSPPVRDCQAYPSPCPRLERDVP